MLHEVEMTNIPIAVSLSHASEDQLFGMCLIISALTLQRQR